MELVNEFTVNRPIDEAWAILTNVERIAPCMPGAELHEIEGDVYRGVVKVKVGPITAALKGEATFQERDDEHHRAVLKGDGRDTKGNGNAAALITASLEEISPSSAKCVVHTELNMTGKVAQFGRGALPDISKKLMAQFAKNLDSMLAKDSSGNGEATPPTGSSTPTATEEAEATNPATGPAAEPASSDANSAPSAKPTVRTINGPAAEPIDAFSLGGSAILKRLVPLLGGLAVLLLVLRRLRRK